MKELYKAIHKVQGQIVNVATDSSNPHFKSTYVSLEQLIHALKPLWVEAGLLVTQFIDTEKRDLLTVVCHAESGEVEKFSYPIINQKGDLHGMGAAFTYSRRQALKGIFGIAEEDDDGNKATAPTPKAHNRPAVERSTQKTGPDNPPLQSQPKGESEAKPQDIRNHASNAADIPNANSRGLSDAQWKRAQAIAHKAGWDKDTLIQSLLQVCREGYGTKFRELSQFDYNELCAAIESGASAAEIISAKRGTK